MSAGFATYLGPYQYNFRRLMLTIHWPNCLRERGIPLAIDSIDEVKGKHMFMFHACCHFYHYNYNSHKYPCLKMKGQVYI